MAGERITHAERIRALETQKCEHEKRHDRFETYLAMEFVDIKKSINGLCDLTIATKVLVGKLEQKQDDHITTTNGNGSRSRSKKEMLLQYGVPTAGSSLTVGIILWILSNFGLIVK